MTETLPLPAQLSAAFVALAVEIDNTAEQQIAHHTTSYGGSSAGGGTVWLASIAMWFNALRALVDVDTLTVGEVRRRTGLDTNVDGLRRWGYVTVDGVGTNLHEQKRPAPKPGSVLRLSSRGRDAAEVWAPLPATIEQHWRDRFGGAAVDRLRAALAAVLEPEQRALPDYLPILTFGLWAERHRAQPLGGHDARPAADRGNEAALPLISLLARALLALTLDYEAGARLALPVWADGLRLLTVAPSPVRALPARAGVGTQAMAMVLAHLERLGCAEITSVQGRRGKQVWLTERGERARSGGMRRFAALGRDRAGRSNEAVDELHAALDPLVGDGSRAGSPLFAGLEPAPANWRAKVRPPESLPWHPLVLHRGGYPDGS